MTPYNAQIHLSLQIVHATPEAAHDSVMRRIADALAGTPHTVSSVEITQLSATEAMQESSLRHWQESIAVAQGGTPSQRARWERGALPEQEVVAIARVALFAPLATFAVRSKMTAVDIHRAMPFCAADSTDIRWETRSDVQIPDPGWHTYKQITFAAKDIREHEWMVCSPRSGVTVDLREHRGTCCICGRHRSQLAALVTVTWAGRTLSREYLLT